ncbi:MAG TPA: hypothetical protein DCM05_16755 [Elusimicrobia bacterium]|nr:hypothetical protein [Elusimicrobiota bacterium]
MTRFLAAALCLLWASPAGAIKPEPSHLEDARRFGQGAASESLGDSARVKRAREAVRRFNEGARGRYASSLRAASLQPTVFAPAAKAVADAFLRKSGALLGIDPSELKLALARADGGIHHLLFEQVHEGIPVEFSRVKVHVDSNGDILSVESGYRDASGAAKAPLVAERSAAQAASADLGGGVELPPGSLSYYPKPGVGLRLAWKFRAHGQGGRWLYYVDALDGSLLFRYNDLRYAVCNTSGQITGDVYDYLPETQPVPLKVVRPFAHQRVYIGDASHVVETDLEGKFCSLDSGKIFTSLQGPYANVASFMTASAHYDNAGGEWTTFSSPNSSPHPYPNSAVILSTINAPSAAQGACSGLRDPVKVLPNFTNFRVGTLSEFADITDADYVEVLDGAGYPAAVYVGNKGSFRGAAVAGRQLRLRLTTSESGQFYGFDVNVSSYLCLKNNPTLADNSTSSFTWTSTRTVYGTNDEVSLFYHVNKVHDYFMGGPNFSSSAFISRPLPVMANLGPGINNAFYDPVGRFLAFGDVMDFPRDGSIVYHEYVHYVVDQIYPILNFGQNGAISEALSDYFTASALNTSKIGAYVSGGGEGSLRDLDSTLLGGCSVPTSNCKKFPDHWTGELHFDSFILSQALWEIRQGLASGPLGAANGRKCADQLVFRSLFFFPDNFRDFLEGMLQVSARAASLAPSCLGNDQHTGLILGQFSQHGIVELPRDQEDLYEPNDGIQSAVDITTNSLISARVYPAADMDYYSFGAGAGPMRLTLTLPENPAVPGTRFAYEVMLIDKGYNLIKEVMPTIDINPAVGSGLCPNGTDPCLTSQKEVVLEYNVPSAGQYFVLIAAGLADYTDYASNGNTNSSQYYQLQSEYNRTGPVGTRIITASYDNDTVSFQVGVSVFGSTAAYGFHHARLRDHALAVLPETETNLPGSYLTFVSSSLSVQPATATVLSGTIAGQLRLQPGFARRFPAVGTVFLEIFGESPLARAGGLYHHPTSLGFSTPLNLTARENNLTAWNNVFNPARGEHATFKYETIEAGHVRLRLFTLNGALVKTVVDSDLPAGKGSVDWDGTNSAGNRVASGIYYLHLDAPGGSRVQKVVVVK